jgi:hypothetical protein
MSAFLAARSVHRHDTPSPGSNDNEDPHLWADEDYEVILLDGDRPDGMTLRSVLQAMGAQVHLGPHTAETDRTPLILVHARNRHQPEIATRLGIARHVFPTAPVGFVTGDIVPAFAATGHDDARRLLGAAGIGFVSVPALS